jgi:choline-sulfatase
MLGERGLWYKMCFFEWAVRVPLIFRAPSRFAPRRAPELASLLDLLPTLLDLGRPQEGGMATIEHEGMSLVPVLHGGAMPERTVPGEYLAEGALAPILMIRRGLWKFIWSEPDPPMLFDLERDPDELENLAAAPRQASTAGEFVAEVRRLWDPARLRDDVLKSQRARRLAFDALTTGRHTSWDFQPLRDAARQYARNHRDLDHVERTRRFPPPKT